MEPRTSSWWRMPGMERWKVVTWSDLPFKSYGLGTRIPTSLCRITVSISCSLFCSLLFVLFVFPSPPEPQLTFLCTSPSFEGI